MNPKDDQSKKADLFNVSRRDFLKSASVGGLVTAVTGVAEVEAQAPGAQVIGPGEVPVQLNVNGKRVELRIEPRVTSSMRFVAAPTSPATSVDATAARVRRCTMIVDGRTIYSCSTLAIESGQAASARVEASRSGNKFSPGPAGLLPCAMRLLCGFCTRGIRHGDVGFLEKYPRPPIKRVQRVDGNICRCETFARIWRPR